MEQGDGHQLQGSRRNTTSPPILHRVLTYRLKQRQVLRIGDIWIHNYLHDSLNHFSRFYIPSVEDLFHIVDWIMRVENFGHKSHLIHERSCHNDKLEL
jgi:hypothetical protein